MRTRSKFFFKYLRIDKILNSYFGTCSIYTWQKKILISLKRTGVNIKLSRNLLNNNLKFNLLSDVVSFKILYL